MTQRERILAVFRGATPDVVPFMLDLAAASPAEVILRGDNISGDVQFPRFFEAWSAPFYRWARRRPHAAGKYMAWHIDGRLKGALGMIRATGADCADAVTPAPMGDLPPPGCRDEAGPEFILSGGVSPDLWLATAPIEGFRRAVIEWLELRKRIARLIAGAGDQVPPGAGEDRILVMRDLVGQYGRYLPVVFAGFLLPLRVPASQRRP